MTEEQREELDPQDEDFGPDRDADEGPVADAPAPAPAKDWSDDEEEEARLLGWKSPDEWQGERPPNYIDSPKAYLERLEKSTPFRRQRELMEERMRKLQAAMDSQTQRAVQREREDAEARIKQIEARQRRAVEEADTDTYDRLAQLRTQEQQRLAQAEQPAPREDAAAAYAEAHPWLTDPVIRQMGAQAIDAAFRSGALPTTSGTKEQIEYAEAHVRKYFPHMFQQEQQPAPKPKVDSGGLGVMKKRSGFDALPKDAREAFMSQVRKGIFQDTKEDREFFFNEYSRA